MGQDKQFTHLRNVDGMEEAMEQAAEEAWTAYRNAVGGKALNGEPLPTWADLKNDPEQQAVAARWLEATRMATLFSCAVSVDTLRPAAGVAS